MITAICHGLPFLSDRSTFRFARVAYRGISAWTSTSKKLMAPRLARSQYADWLHKACPGLSSETYRGSHSNRNRSCPTKRAAAHVRAESADHYYQWPAKKAAVPGAIRTCFTTRPFVGIDYGHWQSKGLSHEGIVVRRTVEGNRAHPAATPAAARGGPT